MTDAQADAYKELSLLAAFWPGTPDDTIAAYAAEFADWDQADLMVARHTIVADGTWRQERFPPPKVVREHLRMAKADRERTRQLALLPTPGAQEVADRKAAYLGEVEISLRAHRLRVGLRDGLRGPELVAFTEAPQGCDNDPPEEREDALRRAAAELAGLIPHSAGCTSAALAPAWKAGRPVCQGCGVEVPQPRRKEADRFRDAETPQINPGADGPREQAS